MEINISYFNNLSTNDKSYFSNELQKVVNLLVKNNKFQKFDDVLVLKNIEDFYSLHNNTEIIFNETVYLREDDISHLTVYFTEDDIIKFYLIVKEHNITNSKGKNEYDRALLRYRLYKEILKIYDNKTKVENNLSNLIFNTKSNLNSSIMIFSNFVWEEYISTKNSISIMQYKEFISIDEYLKVIYEAKSKCDELVSNYFDSETFEYYDEIEYQALRFLRNTASIIAYFTEVNNILDKDYIKQERNLVLKELKKNSLYDIYIKLEKEIVLLEAKNIFNYSLENIEEINKIVFDTLMELGLEYSMV